MKVSVTLSANAGVAIRIGGRCIWVDALPYIKTEGFSVLNRELAWKIFYEDALGEPDWYCCTHYHPDHYCMVLTDDAEREFKDMKLLLPQEEWGKEHIGGDGEINIRFVRLPHDGKQYAEELHYGMIISYMGKNMLISGDCAVAHPAMAEAIGGQQIHLAIMNFPWLTLRRGREFVSKYLPDARILLVHLPFAEDDINGYRAAAQRAVQNDPAVQLLMEPLQRIEIDI